MKAPQSQSETHLAQIRLQRFYSTPNDVHVCVSAHNDAFSAAIDIDLDLNQAVPFAKALRSFLRSSADQVGFVGYWTGGRDIGSFRIRVVAMEDPESAAIELRFHRNLPLPNGADARFGILADVAAVRELGNRLLAWFTSDEDIFEYNFPAEEDDS